MTQLLKSNLLNTPNKWIACDPGSAKLIFEPGRRRAHDRRENRAEGELTGGVAEGKSLNFES
jgi:hypothetical protein